MAPTKWGILGAGKIANDFMLGVLTLSGDDHQVIAVGARTLARAVEFASKFSIPKRYGSYAELVNDEDIDIIYVAIWNAGHLDAIKLALNAGRPVLCEKPLCLSQKETHEAISLAKEKKLFLMEGVWSRFFPAYYQIREEMRKGAIGIPMVVTATFGICVPERFRHTGGGATHGLGMYMLQFSNWVFEDQPIDCVATGLHEDHGVDVTVSFSVQYSKGRFASFLITLATSLPNEGCVFGTDGDLKIHPVFCPTRLTMNSVMSEFPLPHTDGKQNYMNSTGFSFEASHVRQCLLQGKTESPIIPLSESKNLARWMDDIHRQIKTDMDCLKQ